jgi:hypothetical protein
MNSKTDLRPTTIYGFKARKSMVSAAITNKFIIQPKSTKMTLTK